MDFARLREFEGLFGRRWEALVLLCLADARGPLRFAQLAAAMNDHADERLSDGTLTRSLHQLEHQQLIQAVIDQGHKMYGLTTRGAHKAGRLRVIMSLVDEHTDGAA